MSHNLCQRRVAGAGDVKYAVTQRMGPAVMLLQPWPGSQSVMPGYELFTDMELDTAVAIPREYAREIRTKVIPCRTVC